MSAKRRELGVRSVASDRTHQPLAPAAKTTEALAPSIGNAALAGVVGDLPAGLPPVALQRAALEVQRKGKPKAKAAAAPGGAARKEDKEFSAMLAIQVDLVVSGQPWTLGDAAGLPKRHVEWLTFLHEVVRGRAVGTNRKLSAGEREKALARFEAIIDSFRNALYFSGEGMNVATKFQQVFGNAVAEMTKAAMNAKAYEDAALGAALVSRPAQEARASALEGLQKAWAVASGAGDSIAELGKLTGGAAKQLEHLHNGIGSAFAVVSATDAETYKKAIADARFWTEDHKAGAIAGTAKGVAVVSDIVDVTVGTVSKVGTTLSKIGIAALKPKGESLDALLELAKAGQKLKGGKTLAALGKVIGFLDKVDDALAIVGIAGGVAKLVTADTKGERLDAGIKVATGGAGLAAKKLGEKAVAGVAGSTIGAAASGVAITWEYVKFVGDLAIGGIEGSMFGGLYQELAEIEKKGDELAKPLIILGRLIDDRNKNFGHLDVTDPKRAGADEAIQDAAYKVQNALSAAGKRWQNTKIDALRNAFATQVQVDIKFALERGRDGEQVADAAQQFLAQIAAAYASQKKIVLKMLVDAGYMSKKTAALQERKMAAEAAAAN